jgi:hypothetical protein
MSAGPERSDAAERSDRSGVEWPAALLVLLLLVVLALVFYHLAPGLLSGGAVEVIIRPG